MCAELLGFNNRTCSTSLSPKTTAGPVMRAASQSSMWKEWLVRVDGQDTEKGTKRVSLQAFIDPTVEEEAKCLGFVSTFYDSPGYQATCALPPHGNGLFLNGTKSTKAMSAQSWVVRSRDDQQGVFELVAATKPESCARVLGVENCGSQPVLLTEQSTGNIKTWKIVKKYDIMPLSTPPPPGSQSPPPPSPDQTPYPGPVISAPGTTSMLSVNVAINSIGGDARCSVVSIEIVSSSDALGSSPKYVLISDPKPGMGISLQLSSAGINLIAAVGICSNGELTAISNVLSVLASIPDSKPRPPPPPSPPPPPPPPPPVYTLVGVNDDGLLYYKSNIFNGTWTNGIAGFITSACSLSGSYAAAINSTGNVVESTATPETEVWTSRNVSGTSVSIGANKQGIYLSPSAIYTNDLLVNNPSTVNTVGDLSGPSMIQVSLDGTAVLARSATDLYYVADASTASSWGTALSLPSGVTPSWCSLSGKNAVISKSKSVYYTTDITASPVVWQTVTPMPTENDFTENTITSIISVDIAGYVIAFTVDNGNLPSGSNIFQAPDFRTPVWDHPGGNLDCISISLASQ